MNRLLGTLMMTCGIGMFATLGWTMAQSPMTAGAGDGFRYGWYFYVAMCFFGWLFILRLIWSKK
jgi:hypothetical protein